MKMRVDFLTQITNTKEEEHKKKVDQLIQIRKNENPKLIVDNEILKQEERFREKLKNKKKIKKNQNNTTKNTNVFTPNLLINSPLNMNVNQNLFTQNQLNINIKKEEEKKEEEKKEEEKKVEERCIKGLQTMANSSFQYELPEASEEIPLEVDEDKFVELCGKFLGFAQKEM